MWFFRNKVYLLLSAIILALLFLTVLLIWRGRDLSLSLERKEVEKNMLVAGQNEAAAEATAKLLDEVKDLAEKEGDKPGSDAQIVSVKREKNGTTTEERAVVIGYESSPISLETGEVLNGQGDKVKTDVGSGSLDGPRVSNNITDPSVLPESVVKLTLFSNRIEPASFTVKAGQAVSLAVANSTGGVEILRFEDSSLSAVVVGLYKDQLRAISFNAPLQRGEYVYYSEMSRGGGAAGKMTVE